MKLTIAYLWCDGHFISINICKMWGARTRVQVFKKDFHIHIYLDYSKVEFLSCKKKRKQKERSVKLNLSKQRQVAEENSFSLGLRLQKFTWFYHQSCLTNNTTNDILSFTSPLAVLISSFSFSYYLLFLAVKT